MIWELFRGLRWVLLGIYQRIYVQTSSLEVKTSIAVRRLLETEISLAVLSVMRLRGRTAILGTRDLGHCASSLCQTGKAI